nr:MAG: spike glycoprotein [Bovine nidovirus 1]
MRLWIFIGLLLEVWSVYSVNYCYVNNIKDLEVGYGYIRVVSKGEYCPFKCKFEGGYDIPSGTYLDKGMVYYSYNETVKFCNHTIPFLVKTPSGSGVWDGKELKQDPMFVNGNYTRLPTVGSCREGQFYRFAGDYRVVTSVLPCYIEQGKLQVQQNFTIYLRNLSNIQINFTCYDLCDTMCSEQFVADSLWQVCMDLVDKFKALGVKFVDKPGKLVNLSYTIHNITFTNKTISKVKEFKFDFDEFFKAKYAKSYPQRSQAAADLGLFGQVMFNSDHDIRSIAALPWLAAWRYGTQINMLSTSMGDVIQNTQAFINMANKNFQELGDSMYQLTTIFNKVLGDGGLFKDVAKNFDILEQRSVANTILLKLNLLYIQLSVYFSDYAGNSYEQIRKECSLGINRCSPLLVKGWYENHDPYDHIVVVNNRHVDSNVGQLYFCVQGDMHIAPLGCFYRGSQLYNLNDSQPCFEKAVVKPGCDPVSVIDFMVKLNKIKLANLDKQYNFDDLVYNRPKLFEKIKSEFNAANYKYDESSMGIFEKIYIVVIVVIGIVVLSLVINLIKLCLK